MFAATVNPMPKTLVICEKPSVATDVAKALTSSSVQFAKQPWGFSSAEFLVTAAAGHLVAELPPDRYDEKYKTWSFDDLPILPERFMYEPRDSRAGDRLRQLATLMRDPDVDVIVNACDAGREGELIFKLIVQYARLEPSKTIRRAWFSSMTPTAITTAFANLRDDNLMLPLEFAARCRSEADWYVGMNATRAASCTLGGGRSALSMGRVQTPTLALVVNRDVEIDAFVPQDYFKVRAVFSGGNGPFTATWRSSRDAQAVDRFDDLEAAELVAARVKAAATGTVVDVEVQAQTVNPPKLFDLTELQREANRRYGMTAAKTLVAAQACYETHKVLSYPRTDSRYLPSDMEPQVSSILQRVATADPSVAAHVSTALAAGPPAARVIDDNKISDHHALIPTDAAHDLSKLSVDERKIYDLVARRFIAALLDAQQLERTVIWVDVSSDLFRASGVRVVVNGWKDVQPDGKEDTEADTDNADEESESLPAVEQGERRQVEETSATRHVTKPPTRYNESSLLGAMATAGRLVTDDEAAEAMKESGLGTPATRASIIERLVSSEYMERAGRQLRATAKGRGLIVALGEHPLTRPDMTGEWERRLRMMERATPETATADREKFVADVKEFTAELVTSFVDRTPADLAAGRRRLATCPVPDCSGHVVEGRKAWGCDTYVSAAEPGCGFIVWKEQSAKKITEKQLFKQIEDVRSGAVQVVAPVERVEIADCPMCDGRIVTRPKSYGCNSYKSPKDTGCGYSIWKTNIDGTECTLETALELIARGETNGRPPAEVIMDCPRCKGQIVEREKSLSCNSWSPSKAGCGTVVWKMQAGSLVDIEELKVQLEAMRGTKAPKRKPRKQS